MASSNGWHDEVFFGIHYDLHANEKDTELGRALTHEHLRERLMQVRPDWIQCDCKGHPGWTSWPTDLGSTSPGVVNDALRIHRDVTRELGIRLGMHYSGVIDQRVAAQHPEWCECKADGTPSGRGAMCRRGPYLHEFLIPHLIEIIDKYDVDGFWVDGENWGCAPCWCDRCRKAFRRETGLRKIPEAAGQPHWDEWLAFQRRGFFDYVTAYTNAVHARKPECAVCSNWMYTMRSPERVDAPVDYLSGDYVPDWGAARAAVEGRMLDQRPRSWDLMAWAFSYIARGGYGEGLYQFKNAFHLQQEVSEVVALGGAVMLYVQPERNGWLPGWQNAIFAEVADFCRARRDVCFQSQAVPQAAVLHPAAGFYAENAPLFNFGSALEPIEGALQALLETHRSTDILPEDVAMKKIGDYGLVVVPERTRLGLDMVRCLEKYARSGGQVLISGAHLCEETPDLVGADPVSGEKISQARMAVGDQAVRLMGPWRAVKPRRRVETLACGLAGDEPSNARNAEVLITRRPVGAKGGAIVAVHGPLFRNYFVRSYPLIRRLIGGLVAAMPVPWMLEVDRAPAWLEFLLRRKGGRLTVSLVHRGAGETLSVHRPIVEEAPPVTGVRFRVRLDRAPRSVTLAPSGQAVQWAWAGGWCQVLVPSVEILETVVFE